MPEEQPAKSRIEAIADHTWNLAKLAGIVLLAVFFIFELARECLDDGVRLRPVIIRVAAVDDAPTSEMATQQILGYLNLMQSTGAHEWQSGGRTTKEARVADAAIGSQPISDISIQIPGTSFTLGGVVREVASFLPNQHRTLDVSITPGLKAAEYEASLTVGVGRETRNVTCSSSDKPAFGYDRAKALDSMFKCLAFEAVKSIDVLYAASYLLSEESKGCGNFNATRDSANVAAIDGYVGGLRGSCGFDQTRDLVAKIIARGKKEEVRRISYFIGKLRSSRAAALKGPDLNASFFELDRAIARYGELPDDDSGPTLAISVNAMIDKAITLHTLAANGGWKTNEAKRQLDAAVELLVQADGRLAASRSGFPAICLAKGLTAIRGWMLDNLQKSPDTVTLLPMLRGLIKYRLWMISRDRFSNDLTNRNSEVERAFEDAQLREAVDQFAIAYCAGRRTEELYMEWGDALMELRDFDGGVEKFRRAADLSPADDGPFLNIALALLRKVSNDGPDIDATAQLEAMRAVADHLAWASTGGPGTPYSNLIAAIKKALAWPKDNPELQSFNECLYEHDPYLSEQDETKDPQHHRERAQLKICVDATRDRLVARVAGAYTINR